MSYPADPPRVEEIIAVMRQAGEDATAESPGGDRRAVARRTANSEVLALTETDFDPARGSVRIRHGKGR